MLGLSGGKDSLVLLHLLGEIRRKRVYQGEGQGFKLTAVHVRTEGVDYLSSTDYLAECAAAAGAQFLLRSVQLQPDRKARRTHCFLCAWQRRKAMFQLAQELGCSLLALGHHQDDLLHTALLNLTYAGTFSTMAVRQPMRKFPLTIIRPLALCREADIQAFALEQGMQPMLKRCPYDAQGKRRETAETFAALQQFSPQLRQSLWHALEKEGKLTAD